mmetsp:Transcript_53763/g.123683  ORF Transcript_53763/g.123683 Transcript_53763/m.123683 type:complete len:223 (-) Transcript_53763:28-696(-)
MSTGACGGRGRSRSSSLSVTTRGICGCAAVGHCASTAPMKTRDRSAPSCARSVLRKSCVKADMKWKPTCTTSVAQRSVRGCPRTRPEQYRCFARFQNAETLRSSFLLSSASRSQILSRQTKGEASTTTQRSGDEARRSSVHAAVDGEAAACAHRPIITSSSRVWSKGAAGSRGTRYGARAHGHRSTRSGTPAGSVQLRRISWRWPCSASSPESRARPHALLP